MKNEMTSFKGLTMGGLVTLFKIVQNNRMAKQYVTGFYQWKFFYDIERKAQ
jgi:hypothetical protein